MAGKKFLKFWFPVLIYSGIIFMVSSFPNLKTPTGGPLSDKIWHVLEYLPYGFLMARALNGYLGRPRMVLGLAILLSCLYGLSDEVHQLFVEGRVFSLLDVAADALGSIIGVVLFDVFQKRKGMNYDRD